MRSEFDERVNALKKARLHITKADAKEWSKKYVKNQTTKQ